MEKAKKPKKAGKDTSGMVPVEKIKKEFPDASPQRVARLQTMLGDKTTPMKKERLFEGDKGRRKKLFKKLKDQAGKTLSKISPLGAGFAAKDIVSKVSSKLNEPVKKASGGRIGYKSGSKGCKLAMKGKGRAYGKNS